MNADIARRNMVDCQLRTNRVTDERVLAAFEAVPRERFVPTSRRSMAYIDEDIQIAPNRYLMEPRVLGRLLQSLNPAPAGVAMVVGCGMGYAAAILARVVQTVVAVESAPDLARQANAILAELGVDNVAVVNAPHADGYPDQAPYDTILINGAVSEVPPALSGQLADGGRLAAVRRNGPVGEAVLYLREGGTISERVEFDATVPMLAGFEKAAAFVF
jgi:protein-L-isoaspartate(D-aspartate) O-methyltransferase